MRTHILLMTTLALTVSCVCTRGAFGAQDTCFKGKLQIVAFNLTQATEHNYALDTHRVFHQADMQTYRYDVYQNSEGIIREELTYMSRNRSIEPPLDVKIFDYAQGYEVAFNKSGKEGVRWLLRPPVSPTKLENRRILGRLCRGLQYEWESDGHSNRRQLWLPADNDFRAPLLEMRYSFDKRGSLLYLDIRVVTEVEEIAQLPESLFRIPEELKVTDIPSLE